MSEKNNHHETKLAGHSYDGIEELDNNLPKWWLYLFYITIAFGGIYFYHYQMGGGKTQIQEFDIAKNEMDTKSLTAAKDKKAMSEDSLLALFKDTGRQHEGKEIFTSKCVACHGNLGQGGIGPNLTDKYWIHGGKATDIVKTITIGVAEKGMPPWGAILKEDEVYNVAAYIRSLQGSNPPGAKAPQGELVE